MNVRKHSVISALILAISTVGVAATASAADNTMSNPQTAHKTMTHKKTTKHHTSMTHKKKTTRMHNKHKTPSSTKSTTKPSQTK